MNADKDTTKLSLSSSRRLELVTYALLLLGGLVRLVVYLQNRSLIIDEANVARNIVERDFLGLFQPLDYQQYAPPLFTCFSKLMINSFGVTEWALKFFPLLSSWLGLWLFYRLGRNLIKQDIVLWYSLILLCFSPLAIRYSTEFKQYSSDLTLTLLFLLWAIRERNENWTWQRLGKWFLAGAVAIWLSMPMIFILASIGFFFLAETGFKDRQTILRLVILGAGWLFSFASYYLLILNQDIQTEGLQAYHEVFFFDLFPTTKAALEQDWKMIENFFRLVADKTVLSIAWAMLMTLLAVKVLWRRDRGILMLLVLPWLFCLVAAHFHLYSLISRLILFLIPSLMLLVAVGVDTLWQQVRKPMRMGILILLLITIVNREGYRYFWERMEFEDTKQALITLLAQYDKQEQPLVYVHADAVPGFIFYTQMHKNAIPFPRTHLATWEEIPSLVWRRETQDADHLWLFFSHTFPDVKQRQLEDATTFAKEIFRADFQQAAVHKFRVVR